MDLKAPKKLCALREIFRHKYCPYSEVSPLHSSVSIAQQKTCEGCPLQHCTEREQMLGAHAVISSCVKRMWDKGWQDRLCAGKMERGFREVHARAWWRRVQPFSEGLSLPLLVFLWFHWRREFLNVMWMTPRLKCDAACQWWDGRPTQCDPFLSSLHFSLIKGTKLFPKRNRIKLEFTLIRFPAVKQEINQTWSWKNVSL